MAPNIKVAVIQLYPKPLQPADNFARAATFIRSAAQQGAQLIVLPEYHLTNWLPTHPKFRDSISDWQSYLRAYQDLAKECDICIVPGTIVQPPENAPAIAHSSTPQKDVDPTASPAWVPPAGQPAETGCMNTAYFISHTGEILGSYQKKNLWGPTERAHLSSSGRQPHTVINTPIGKIGLLICWDLAFPEAFRELISQGAKIIIMPTFWTLSDASDAGLRHNPSAEAVFIDAMTTARAFENTCAVVLANCAGKPARSGKMPVYLGHSQICVPFVGPVAKLDGISEGMIVADIDMAILEDAEANYHVRKDIAHEDWHYDYRHTVDDEKDAKSKL